MAFPSVDDLVRRCGLSDEELNKEITRDRFHEIKSSLLDWRLLTPILNLTELEVEDIERANRGEELKITQFLSAWKRKQCEHATYRALVVALCKIERREGARKVCEVVKGISSSAIPISPSSSTLNPPAIISDPPLAPVGSLSAIFDPPSPSTEVLPSLFSESSNLESTIRRLNKKFENVVESLEEYLLENEVPVKKLQSTIKHIPISLKSQLGEYFQEQTSKIFKIDSVPELVEFLSRFWYYLNPGLLTYFVGKFGSEDNIRSMEKYSKELEVFRRKVKISEYLQAVSSQEDLFSHRFYKRIVTQMGKDWEKETLQDVEEYANEFSEKLCIQKFLARFHVFRSSIAIVFCIPKWIQINFVELELFFQHKGVVKVYLNDICLIDWTKEKEDATIYELFKVLEKKTGDEARLIHAGKEQQLRLRGGEDKVLDDLVPLTDEPDMITWDDDPDDKRSKMPCGHAISPDSLTAYCLSLLSAGKFQFFCPYIGGNSRCNKEWTYIEVRCFGVLSTDEQTIFESQISENYLKKAMGIQECPGCHTLCERIKKKDKRLICRICTKDKDRRFDFCWTCLHEWKSSGIDKCGNEGCDGEDPQLRTLRECGDKSVVGVSTPSIRSCPTCGALIAHTEACKHMVCPCGTNFCFICLKIKESTWSCGSFNSKCKPASRQTEIPGQ